MKEKERCFSQYISNNGSSLSINIPKPECEVLGIKKGSLVLVKIEVKRR